MVPRKNIYVREQLLPLLAKFEESGGNASELFSRALESWNENQERQARALPPFERLEVDVLVGEPSPQSRTWGVRAFRGRWLAEAVEDPAQPGRVFGVAQTEKGAFVGVAGRRNEANAREPFDSFQVAETLEELGLPAVVVAQAQTALGGVEFEELDI